MNLRRAAEALGRGLRLRCPRCGRGRLFRGPFRMLHNCAECHLQFEREQGYFVGAIYLNYAATVLVALAGYFLLDAVFELAPAAQLALWGAFCIVFPLWGFRYSKSLWLAFDHYFDPEGRRPNGSGRRDGGG